MKRLLIPLLAALASIAPYSAARAEGTSVWGFPLGVTGEQLRASAGAPTTIRQLHPANVFGIAVPTPKPTINESKPADESWEYDRNGVRYYVTFSDGRTRTVEMMQAFSAGLTSDPGSPLADPLGLKAGDTLGAILLKTGAVKRIEPGSGIQVSMAIIDVTRGDLLYSFHLTSGHISMEWVTLLSRT